MINGLVKKGLELTARTLERINRNYDDANLLGKTAKVCAKAAVCIVPGMMPHKIQEKESEMSNTKPATQTLYSSGVGLGVGVGRFVLGNNLDNIILFNLPSLIGVPAMFIKFWGVYTFSDAAIRFGYAGLTKKSLGTFLLEAGAFLYSVEDPLKENEHLLYNGEKPDRDTLIYGGKEPDRDTLIYGGKEPGNEKV